MQEEEIAGAAANQETRRSLEVQKSLKESRVWKRNERKVTQNGNEEGNKRKR